jgi:hypothetical protein
MRVLITIDDQVFTDIRRCLGNAGHSAAPAHITFEALALFNWAAKRRRQGLILVGANALGPIEHVSTPLLDTCNPSKA